jgi:hypothetical protein
MTRKIAVSLPDDVADRVAQEDNASAFIAESVRRRMAGEQTRAVLHNLGFELTDESMAHARAELQAARDSVTPELRAQAAELYARIRTGRP